MITTSSERSICARIIDRLAQTVGPVRFNRWFDRTARFEFDDAVRCLRVDVPNRFVSDWIGRYFRDDLTRIATEELAAGVAVELDVRIRPELFKGDAEATAAGTPETAAPAKPAPATPPRRAHAAPEPKPNLRHQLDDFIVGPTNELAYSAARRLARDPREAVNPLFIHGGCGLGKTHLLQGVCNAFLEQNPDARVMYTTGEQFTNEFLVAVRANKIDAFRRRIRRLDLLAVDDVHFIANKQATQQEFLHSFDAIELGGARVVLASDNHPRLIQQFSTALVSRCLRGMVVEVKPPDVVTRALIITALAHRRGMSMIEGVPEAIAQRCHGSVREIEGSLAKLHALACLTRQRKQGDAGVPANEPIGHTLVNHLFESDAPRVARRAIRFEQIVEIVAGYTGVPRVQVLGNGRQQHVVVARSLVIHLARTMTTLSYPEIASVMGRTTHSTVITAAQRIEKQIAKGHVVTVPATMERVSVGELAQRLRDAVLRG
ncbi:MAG: chromosomal replication initiator protein DnaA [Planctomycetes bacterium]|nr:chromosomal replication initiator protein DnaA [Planctomycetota bacterium]